MMDAFSGRNSGKHLPVPFQKRVAKSVKLRVLNALCHLPDIVRAHVGIDGCRGHQGFDIFPRQPSCVLKRQLLHAQLRAILIHRDQPGHRDKLAVIGRADAAFIFPCYHGHTAACVKQVRAEVRLSGFRHTATNICDDIDVRNHASFCESIGKKMIDHLYSSLLFRLMVESVGFHPRIDRADSLDKLTELRLHFG